MFASELDYEVPAELIAQAPLPQRDAARLLWLRRDTGVATDRHVRDLPSLLAPSLIVVNDTRVIPARLHLHKASGGKVELLLVERLSPPGMQEQWSALAKPTKGLVVGMPLMAADDSLGCRVIALSDGEVEVELTALQGVERALAAFGRLPLPPYIKRAPDAADDTRYQTVFAAHDGAVAAPTAGLHLSDALIAALRAAGHELAFVTLHVGPGTFAPLRSDDLDAHIMHEERYVVPASTVEVVTRAKAQGRQVLAVGTTVVRTLEAAAADGTLRAGEGRTSIFIRPPYAFRVVDALLTNFHWPKSTLLALVMAFGGIEPVRAAYAHAVASRYRFFSYGDAMLITGAQ
jgi:S-adenosylmethionine:tRNA ribosyltransferase-isomerase